MCSLLAGVGDKEEEEEEEAFLPKRRRRRKEDNFAHNFIFSESLSLSFPLFFFAVGKTVENLAHPPPKGKREKREKRKKTLGMKRKDF